MTFANLKLHFSVNQRESNLAGHIRWLEYLAGPEFIVDWRRSMQTQGRLKQLVDSAKGIVEEDIYSKNTTDGTGSIKASVTGKYVSGQGVDAVVYLDPSVAPSKGPFAGGVPGDFNYAAFFEEPHKFNSFIPDRFDPHDSRRFRPFYFDMQLAQSRISNEIGMSQLLKTIRKRMPRV